MWEGIAGALVSAGAKLIPSLVGEGSDKQEAQWNANYELQQRMAEHGTLIRARDVMRAYAETGIHPLSLMGMNPASASSVASVGGTSSNWRKGVADAGQDIGRAIGATAGQNERNEMMKLQVQRGGLENELLRVQIARNVQELERSAQIGPAMPIGDQSRYLLQGQGQTNTELRAPIGGQIKVVPAEVTATDARVPGSEPGVNPDVKFLRTNDGGLAPVKAKQAQEGLEDDWLGNLWWNNRNRIDTTKSMLPRLPAGKVWEWNIWRGAYYPVDARRDSREMLHRFKRGW